MFEGEGTLFFQAVHFCFISSGISPSYTRFLFQSSWIINFGSNINGDQIINGTYEAQQSSFG